MENLNNLKVFVVFGKCKAVKEDVVSFVRSIGVETIVLEEETSGGKTIIEKLESAKCDKAIIIMSGDDKVISYRGSNQRKCPRQNVIFEYGYFVAKIGRNNTIVIKTKNADLNLLSDCSGICHIQYKKKSKTWQKQLRRELSPIYKM